MASGPGRNKTRRLDTRGLGKGYVDELTEVSTKHLYISEPCPSESKYSRRLSGPDGHYHLPGDIGRSSFLNTPEFVQYTHKEKGLGGQLGDYAWAEEHSLPLQADIATGTAKC